MKYLVIALLLCTSSIIKVKSQQVETSFYEGIFDILKNNKAFQNFTREKYKRIAISPQLVNFDVLGWFCEKQIQEVIPNYKAKDSFGDRDYKYYKSLEGLNSNRNTKYIVFFTEINENLVLAEILKPIHISNDYRTASKFANGVVFLIKINQDCSKIVFTTKVNHS